MIFLNHIKASERALSAYKQDRIVLKFNEI